MYHVTWWASDIRQHLSKLNDSLERKSYVPIRVLDEITYKKEHSTRQKSML